MRRRAGIGAIQKKRLEGEKYKGKGAELSESQLSEMSRQLETFRDLLEGFARDHKQEIKKDPAFRKHFQVFLGLFCSGQEFYGLFPALWTGGP